MSSHIVVLGSYAESLLNFRGELIGALIAKGYRVTAMAPDATRRQIEAIHRLGADYVSYPLQRNGLSIRQDWASFLELRKLFSQLKPDILFAYTIKPVIWGGLAIRSVPKASFFPLITGLGFAFNGTTLRRRALQRLVMTLYRRSTQRADRVFFQNSDNRNQFLSLGLVTSEQAIVVPGSGVNTDRFPVRPFPEGPLVFLMIARLLGEKGTREYVAAAKEVRAAHPDIVFRLAGPLDPSPDGISTSELDSWIQSGDIEYLGELEDVREELARCHYYVLPSYHEGIPRTVLEAMSTGRGVLTTNAAGCKETVEIDVNGFLVEPKQVAPLVERLCWIINNREELKRFGLESRRIVENRFCVHHVNRIIIEQIESATS